MANLVYILPETAIVWSDTTGDLAMTLNNLATTVGRQGAVKDWGTGARALWYAYRSWVQFATAPVVGETVDIYLKTSDGTRPDNDDGTGDIALSSADKLKNLFRLKPIIVDEAATGVLMVSSGFVQLPHRFVMPVFLNSTADNLVASDDVSGVSLTPVPDQIQ